jgi:hypothetical protein
VAVISCGDASPVLKLAKHAFDEVSAFVGLAIQRRGVRREAVEGTTVLTFLCLSHLRRLSAS